MVIAKASEYEMARMTELGGFAVLKAPRDYGIRMIHTKNSLTLLRKTDFLLLFRIPIPGHHFGEIRARA